MGCDVAIGDRMGVNLVDNNKGITQSTADGRYQRIDYYDVFYKDYYGSLNGTYYAGWNIGGGNHTIKITTSSSASSGYFYIWGTLIRNSYNNGSITKSSSYPIFTPYFTIYNESSSNLSVNFRTNDSDNKVAYVKYILLDYDTSSIRTSSSFTLPSYTGAIILPGYFYY